MIIGIATLIMMLFGVGSAETFYIDKIDKHIGKYVTEKGRLNEIKVDLKAYEATVKAFSKEEKKAIKLLKSKNIDFNTSVSWYEQFFETRMNSRKEMQASFMNVRLSIQEKILEDEWTQIMAAASDGESKNQKKEAKEKEKSKMESVISVVSEQITNEEDAKEVELALRNLNKSFEKLLDSYDDQNVNDSAILKDKKATKAQFETLSANLNTTRSEAYESYIVLIKTLKAKTNAEQWKVILKSVNKTFK